MAYDIRPLSFSEILDRAFRVLLDNFVLLFGISAVLWIPTAIFLTIEAKLARPGVATLVDFLVFFVVISIQHAALIDAVREVYLAGCGKMRRFPLGRI